MEEDYLLLEIIYSLYLYVTYSPMHYAGSASVQATCQMLKRSQYLLLKDTSIHPLLSHTSATYFMYLLYSTTDPLQMLALMKLWFY